MSWISFLEFRSAESTSCPTQKNLVASTGGKLFLEKLANRMQSKIKAHEISWKNASYCGKNYQQAGYLPALPGACIQ
jgi:hypothetical protein